MSSAAAEAKLLPEPPLLVLPSLAGALGLNEAIVLQQLHYRSRDADAGWWRATAEDLRGEFPFWSDSTLKRVLAGLRRDGLVETRQDGTDRANRYRVDYASVTKRIGGQSDPIDGVTPASNRADGSGQGEPISLNAVRNVKGKRQEGSGRFGHFDDAVRR